MLTVNIFLAYTQLGQLVGKGSTFIRNIPERLWICLATGGDATGSISRRRSTRLPLTYGVFRKPSILQEQAGSLD